MCILGSKASVLYTGRRHGIWWHHIMAKSNPDALLRHVWQPLEASISSKSEISERQVLDMNPRIQIT